MMYHTHRMIDNSKIRSLTFKYERKIGKNPIYFSLFRIFNNTQRCFVVLRKNFPMMYHTNRMIDNCKRRRGFTNKYEGKIGKTPNYFFPISIFQKVSTLFFSTLQDLSNDVSHSSND
ncbi:hypothetical protein CDIK_4034 [Cucumispora dikerogammari]|nr:hypothetical protein CDIK_4034 [Cucumispora dikerogammari]